MLREFRAFIARGNVLDLAIGVIIGAAFATVIKSLVDDVIMPPLGLLLGKVDFANMYVLLREGPAAPAPYATLADAKAAGAVTINYGVFINSFVAFLLVGLACFIMVRQLMRFIPKPPVMTETKPCPHCITNIPIGAKRCPNCTSTLD